ncbi:DUF4159 domain-containing protein [Oecophyllibacter saccharovorans]|uniref:DUF4159 domain-containing protein n=1 Tax=Oecophyllibacter saccharovorans TaxID=2558360 RepID=UPI00116BA7B5|nr:DUF4159 domain-containing protein [Oecophyllibacter saccharovorans]TPW34974.1 DUF4159 domain-containing protein [Oecophyllibacter saccharovorans]
MMPVSFHTPWLLLFLLALPLLWWLARATPPVPRRQSFSSLVVLRLVRPLQQDAAHTPWWLLALRLLALALLILACAGPVWRSADSSPTAQSTKKNLIILDNGWAAGPFWTQRVQVAQALGERSFRNGGQPFYLLTAPAADGQPSEPLIPEDLHALSALLATLHPQPWPVQRAVAARRLLAPQWQARLKQATVTLLSDGLAQGGEAALTKALAPAARVYDIRWAPCALVRLSATPPVSGDDGTTARLSLLAERLPKCTQKTTSLLRGLSLSGVQGGNQETSGTRQHFDTVIHWSVPVGSRTTVSLPGALAADLDALKLEDVSGPAGMALFGGGAHQKTVGLLRLNGDTTPLLGSAFYLTRALGADVRTGNLENLLSPTSPPLSLLIAPDGTLSPPEAQRKVLNWVRHGGMLVRFAGPELAQSGETGPAAPDSATEAQALLPITLVHGERQLGGPMSWGKPQPLAPFPEHSPFNGLEVPPDITVTRQVLAQPEDDLQARSWASLADGTPLVTARHEGQGMVVLFHITPTAEWSNLALSGLFPAMLERLITAAPTLARSTATSAGPQVLQNRLPPWRIITMTSRLVLPNSAAQALRLQGPLPAVSVDHPAGLYGTLPRLRPLNLPQNAGPLRPEPLLGTPRTPKGLAPATDLAPLLGLAAIALLLLDGLLALLRRLRPVPLKEANGKLPFHFPDFRRTASGKPPLLLLFVSLSSATGALLLPSALPTMAHAGATAAPTKPVPHAVSEAASHPDRGLPPPGALETRLAAIKTGDPEIDRASLEGLEGLTRFLNQRSTAHLGSPVSVDADQAELGFYPLLYWPITPGLTADPTRSAALNDYMKHGGLLMIDELGAGSELSGTSAATARQSLKRATEGLGIPPLMKLDSKHTLSHTFYLLHSMPGRIDGQPVYVARTQGEAENSESVSPVIIGNGDWARAWAVNEAGEPAYAVVPGGETQRNAAYRFGTNAVIYALTGNYKNDQKHYPEMLRRLGGSADSSSPSTTGENEAGGNDASQSSNEAGEEE